MPYRKLLRTAGAAVMVGHMAVPGLTDGLPATLSPANLPAAARRVRLRGLAVTDDLGGMQAVSARYPLPKAALTALTAGADVAFWSSGEQSSARCSTRWRRRSPTAPSPRRRVTDSLARVLIAKGACDG